MSIDWDAATAGIGKSSFQKYPHADGYLGYLWPTANEFKAAVPSLFLSSHNPFLAAAAGTATSAPTPEVMVVRDGSIPLRWFFRGCPKPPAGFRGTFVVSERHAGLVPRAWQKHFGTYELKALKWSAESPKPTRVLFVGLVMDTYCPVAELKKRLQELKAQYTPAEFARLQFQGFLVPKFHGFGNEDRHAYHLDYVQTLREELGKRIEALDWQQFNAIRDLSDTLVVELGDSGLVSDSFLVHWALGAGAVTLDQWARRSEGAGRESKSDTVFVPVSPYHGYQFKRGAMRGAGVAHDNQELAEFLEHLHESVLHPGGVRLPWPQWFQAYAQASR